MGNTASTPPVTSTSGGGGGGKSSSRSSSSRRKSSGSHRDRDRDGDTDRRRHSSSSHRRHSSEGGGGGSGEKGTSSGSALEKDEKNSNSPPTTAEEVAARAQQVVGESVQTLQQGLQKSIKKLEDQDHPAAHFLDSVCGAYMDHDTHHRGGAHGRGTTGMMGGDSFYSDDCSDDDEDDEDRTLSEDETTTTTDYHRGHRSTSTSRGRSRQRSRHHDDPSEAETASFVESDYESEDRRHHHHHRSSSKKGKSTSRSSSNRRDSRGSGVVDEKSPTGSFESEDDSFQRRRSGGGDNETVTDVGSAVVTLLDDGGAIVPGSGAITPGGSTATGAGGISKPLASSFAKRCYFTKSGIGKTTQHYEGLTLTGNVVLMLAAAMKLKGCPTICDEDLRRVEQTYPNQFSRLPDELLLSSGWRRISKYCHFSHKPVPDGIPFFHSKQRLHPTGGYFFLLAAAVGMVRPIDVEPLTRDTLVLLETDFPAACDAAPVVLIQDPDQWTLVDKFCFFSGGPINTDEDVYYQADFDGNPIYMLAFLSPSLTPAELYKLDPLSPAPQDEPPSLKSVAVVEEVESVYDLTERDFDDLKLYHLGPCRALPQYILQPSAWTKVLPPPFLAAREQALYRAEQYEMQQQQQLNAAMPTRDGSPPGISASEFEQQALHYRSVGSAEPPTYHHLHEQQHGAYNNHHTYQPPLQQYSDEDEHDPMAPMDETAAACAMRLNNGVGALDPPEDEPPSLSKRDAVAMNGSQEPMHTFSSVEPNNEAYYNDVEGEYDEHGEYYSVGSPDQMGTATSEDYIEPGASGDPDYDHHQQYADHQGESADYDDDREAEYHHQDEEEYHDDDEFQQHQQMSSDYQQSADDDDDDNDYHGENGGADGMEDYHRRHSGGGMQEYHESGSDPADQDDYQELTGTSSDYNHENDPDPGDSPREYDEGEEDDADMDMEEEHDEEDDEYHEMGGGGSDYHEENMDDYYAQDTRVSYYSSAGIIHEEPGVGQDESLPAGENAQRDDAPASVASRRIDTTMDASPHMRKSDLPPTSPASVQGSEYSHTSSAMRGAQELLKRNRQRRALRKNNNTTNEVKEETIEEPTDALSPKNVISPRSEISGGTWESGSEITSVVSGVSSVWTDSSTNPDRSSRRALILQMAKARMKSNKGGISGAMGGATDELAMRGGTGVAASPASAGYSPHDSEDCDDFEGEEEKKLENLSESATDIDIAGDLD